MVKSEFLAFCTTGTILRLLSRMILLRSSLMMHTTTMESTLLSIQTMELKNSTFQAIIGTICLKSTKSMKSRYAPTRRNSMSPPIVALTYPLDTSVIQFKMKQPWLEARLMKRKISADFLVKLFATMVAHLNNSANNAKPDRLIKIELAFRCLLGTSGMTLKMTFAKKFRIRRIKCHELALHRAENATIQKAALTLLVIASLLPQQLFLHCKLSIQLATI
jgi:hypothetical protein